MTWTRLSDDFADKPELLDLSRSARLLHVEALVYGNRHGNDGRFRRNLVARMTDAEDWANLVDELLKFEVWIDIGDGMLAIDWAACDQEPADRVRDRKTTNAEVNRAYRERGKKHRAGDHSMCTSACSAVRDQSRDASRQTSRDGSRDPYPSRPVPTPREGKGEADGPAGAGAPPAAAEWANPSWWAHPFTPPTERGRDRDLCAWATPGLDRTRCSRRAEQVCHGHGFQQKPTAAIGQCACGQPQVHPVHGYAA